MAKITLNKSQEHLLEAQESYLIHFWYAFKMSTVLLILSMSALLHAIVPGMCTRTVSDSILKLNQKLQKRNNN